MDNMNHLRDLLRFDVRHLYSAEEQIIEALPAMISKANDPQLKQALEQHLRVTEQQRDRLDRVKQLLGENDDSGDNDGGIFSGLFSTGSKSKGIAGLIDEGEKVMGVDMVPAVMDAAIIGCAQKIEHYEIAGYGTARTYAEQLGLTDVAQLLQQTLIEEHDADDLLTSLAVRDINLRAETGAADMNRESTETYR
ncbi:MAG: ferritin-like domain-containing protein [Bacteroidota bacterium]|nr:ferritin-like domain-containing protein [Flavisolibacter sp.]MDQ3845209.1 ferritin-like domain-containing protein [Bacteroidota bacterium]MBD0287041.1 ferritin-like domain-containing protein [Flavisolibacter sp.]MBD0297331.1 ferritin-like domain-containing protein [Flavisolibacter sp.]MBD0350613.1 ferritin-like domain-containing protein [Flavisolibacter sp.]